MLALASDFARQVLVVDRQVSLLAMHSHMVTVALYMVTSSSLMACISIMAVAVVAPWF